jgi:GNAT superfamily N-acetyltransferase
MPLLTYHNLDTNFHDACIAFNETHFRRGGAQRYFDFQHTHNPLFHEPNQSILAIENGEPIGQTCLFPTEIAYNQQKESAFGEVDLIVLPQGRGKGIGKELVKRCHELSNVFVLGISPVSMDLHKGVGSVFHSSLHKFIKLRHPLLSMLTLMGKPSKEQKLNMPQTLTVGNNTFTPTTSAPQTHRLNWSADTLEFVRDEKFMNWRFFGDYNHFDCYYNHNQAQPIYLVTKQLSWNRHQFLAVVDFRLNIHNPDEVKALTEACHQLLHQSQAAGIIIGASTPQLIEQLNQSGYNEFEPPSLLFTNSARITNSDSKPQVMITMADSDLEFAYRLQGHLLRRIIKSYLRKMRR